MVLHLYYVRTLYEIFNGKCLHINHWGISKNVATLWFGGKKITIKGWGLGYFQREFIYIYIYIYINKLMNENLLKKNNMGKNWGLPYFKLLFSGISLKTTNQ